MKSLMAVMVAIFLTVGMVPYAQGVGLRLDGRVYEATSNRGVAALTMKLIPPRALSKPEIITTTNDPGEFLFTNVDRGRYLIEVYQGITILYRGVVEISQDTRKEIPLKGRP